MASPKEHQDAFWRAHPVVAVQDDVQTAMMLTQTEWTDLAFVCRYWLSANRSADHGKLDICRRIIEAVD